MSAAVEALVHRLEESQWLDPDTLVAHQHNQLAVLGRALCRRGAWARDHLGAAGVVGTGLGEPGALSSLPVLGRREIQSAGPAMFVDDLPRQHLPTVETRTSGSTGEPVVVRRTRVSALFSAALTLRDYLWREALFSGRLAVVRANADAHRELPTWGWPVDVVFATGPAEVFPVSVPVGAVADRLLETRPTALLLYPSTLVGIVDELRARGASLTSVRDVYLMGETLTAEARQATRETLGARTWDAYSSEELGLIAGECPDSGLLHVMAENLVVEVLDDDEAPVPEGGVGRVVVTDLHNLATPMLRYAIGDYAEVGPQCPCGRGLPTLARVLGRERNLLRLPDGTRRWPRVGFSRFREVAPVQQYQVVQHSFTEVEVRLVTARPLSDAEEKSLGEVIIDALGHRFDLRFAYYRDRLPVGPTGKFEEFRCELTDGTS